MLYQPTFSSPYLETIDVENPTGNVFKCLINPKNKVIGYEIKILSNLDSSVCCQIKGYLEDVDGTTIQKKAYSLNKGTTWTEFEVIPKEDSVLPVVGNFNDESWLQVLLPPDIDLGLTNGDDYKWNIVLQEETPSIRFATASFNRDFNNKYVEIVPIDGIDATYWEENFGILYVKYGSEVKNITEVYIYKDQYIQLYIKTPFQKTVVEGDSCEILTTCLTSCDYYFKARKTPIVNLEVPDIIESCRHTFTATIDRENISSYKFDLYLGAELINSSENVYSNNISYTYDGFISGNIYSIKLTIITEDDETIIEEHSFKVFYNISNNTILLDTKIDNIVNGVYLDFSKQISTQGVISDGKDAIYKKYKNQDGEIPDTENAIHINKHQSLYWNSINNIKDLIIPSDNTTMIHWHGDLGGSGKILEMSSNELANEKITVGYDSKEFYYKIGTNNTVRYCPYVNGYANVIAGKDEYSVGGQIIEYSIENSQIVIGLTDKVKIGMYISVLGERKLITNVTNGTNTLITLESPFSFDVISGTNYFIYDELRCYVFQEKDIPEDTDIFVENDIGYNYWWLIVVLPNEVKFIKTKRYEDTVVSE